MLRKEYFDMSTYRETLTQYITFKRGGEGSLFSQNLCSLATVTSCIDGSVRIITKSPKVTKWDLYLNSPSLWKWQKEDKDEEGDGLDMLRETKMAEGRWGLETKK